MIDYSSEFYDACLTAKEFDDVHIERISNDLDKQSLLTDCSLII